MDTQWTRFQVFEQSQVDKPHQNAGSVHAPDAEMALLNARDVFVRRPHCVSLWVVPARAILSKTRQELANSGPFDIEADGRNAPVETYHIFQKLSEKGTHVHVGSVEAQSPVQALGTARDTFANSSALVWWVFPARMATCSGEDEIESLFKPAKDKSFREQGHYRTVSLMREIRRKR